MVKPPSPPIKATEYFEVLYNTEEIQKRLRRMVTRFFELYATFGSGFDRQKAWIGANMDLKTLDSLVYECVRSDIHDNALTVDFGG